MKLAQTTPAIPTEQAATSKTIPTPPTFIMTDIYPGIRKNFNLPSIQIINTFMSLLNTALQYASAGTVNLQVFRNSNFNLDASGAPSVDQRNLMNLTKLAFNILLNKGDAIAQPLTGQQVTDLADRILSSQFYQDLSKVQPTGPLANKIQGNLKTIIQTFMMQLKSINPTNQ